MGEGVSEVQSAAIGIKYGHDFEKGSTDYPCQFKHDTKKMKWIFPMIKEKKRPKRKYPRRGTISRGEKTLDER